MKPAPWVYISTLPIYLIEILRGEIRIYATYADLF